MSPRPKLETERLLLRPFRLEDAPEVRRLAGAREVAAGTATIPHPYPEGAAEEWIGGQREDAITFAIEQREDGALVGAIGLHVEPEDRRAEIGYWVGVPYWGRGYATEAARAVVDHGFAAEGLNRIYAFHFTNNPASGRVLQKAGLRHEGIRRKHTLKWGEYLDNECYSILRDEWERR